jgi:hypothetical protein
MATKYDNTQSNAEIERRRREEEEARRKQEEDNTRLRNVALGDMLNTGIPGGIDMDITTPW